MPLRDCGVLPDGRTAFNLIQNATDTGEGSLVFFLFDLLFLDGENLIALPLVERKARLARQLQPLVVDKMPLAIPRRAAPVSDHHSCFRGCIGCARKWSSK
jgi:ATP-dependent DNA ligase